MGAYVIIVVFAELLWMPRMWGLFAGGVLFGPVTGAVLSVVSDTISAAICYNLARSTGRDFVAHLVARKPSTGGIVHVLAEKRGTWTVALLRVCPIAHYTLVSYAAGLAGTPARAFFLGSTIGILPGAVLYPLVGGAALRPTSPVFIVSTAVLLLFLVATILVAKRSFRPPSTMTEPMTEPMTVPDADPGAELR